MSSYSKCGLSILNNAELDCIVMEPFPHLVVRKALPPELYAQLANEYPSIDTILSDGKVPQNNRRYQINAQRGLSTDILHESWREFVQYHVSSDFWGEVVAKLGPAIRHVYPALEEQMGRNLGDFSLSVRGEAESDVVLDCQPGINSPVTRVSSVRGPHVDNPVELFAGLLYFRSPEDDSTGGDLVLHRHRRSSPTFWGKAGLWESDVEPFATIPYEANTLVLFINGPESIHAVTPRSLTQHPRRLVNFIGEIYGTGGLFKLPRNLSTLGRIKNKWFSWRHGG